MSTPINDGGPAFPHAHEDYPFQHGMSLRDYFAGQALVNHSHFWDWACGISKQEPGTGTPEDYVARACYAMADAMLAERAKGGAK